MAHAWLVGLALLGGKGDAETIGDVVSVVGMGPVKIEGIGLITGLPGTGSEPPPGMFRDAVLALMRKNDVHNPQQLLESKSVAAVLVRGFLPPGARKGDRFDLEIAVVPGDQATKSIRGGFLMPMMLREMFVTKGGALQGAHLANAEGRVVVMDAGKAESGPQSGKVLGGGKATADRELALKIASGRRSVRLSKEIAALINARFPIRADRTLGPAEAKRDELVQLKPIATYKHNLERYLLTIRKIPLNLDERGQMELRQRLKSELLDPATSYSAALRLEALGPSAAPVLAAGLASSAQLVRFGAAEALSYLGDPRSVKELGACAEAEPLYRPYALAALAANPMPVSGLKLVQLLQASSVEARYGAFRALLLLDEKNPAVMGEFLADEFWLHALPSRTPPLAHAARRHRQEIVLFGDQQKFVPPLLVRLGDRYVIQSVGTGSQLMLAKFVPGKEPQRLEAPNNVGDAIRGLASLGAGYTDAVELLRQASGQNAMEGRFEVNALPRAANLAEVAASGRDSAGQMPTGLPSMFQDGADEGSARVLRLKGETAAAADADKPDDGKAKPSFWRKIQFWRAN